MLGALSHTMHRVCMAARLPTLIMFLSLAQLCGFQTGHVQPEPATAVLQAQQLFELCAAAEHLCEVSAPALVPCMTTASYWTRKQRSAQVILLNVPMSAGIATLHPLDNVLANT